MTGWIKLHRKLLDNPVFKNHKLLQTFMYCLLKASHSDHELLVGCQVVNITAGQLVTGRKAISIATGLSEQNVKTALKSLVSLQMLTIKPTTKYSIISVTSWDSYQQANQQTNQPLTNNQPTTNQQLTTNKNVNNVKNGKNSTPAKPKHDEEDMRFAQWMADSLPDIKKPNLDNWANTVRLMREIDKRNHRDMGAIWLWARSDHFWQANILSAEKFRKQYDTLVAQSKRPAGSTGYQTANEKAAARSAQTQKMDSPEDLEF